MFISSLRAGMMTDTVPSSRSGILRHFALCLEIAHLSQRRSRRGGIGMAGTRSGEYISPCGSPAHAGPPLLHQYR
jgi:hypothetical protein